MSIDFILVIIIIISASIPLAVLIPILAQDFETKTVRTYSRDCTLDSLSQYRIEIEYSCPLEQVIIHDWEALSPLDKTAIDFILRTNDYHLEAEEKVSILTEMPLKNDTVVIPN